jgi:hypothetical protein
MRSHAKGIRKLFAALAVLLSIGSVIASGQSGQTRNDLLPNFRNVPPEAQPRVWWHWMNANITKAGIEKK